MHNSAGDWDTATADAVAVLVALTKALPIARALRCIICVAGVGVQDVF